MSAFPANDPNSTFGNGITTEDDYACATITVTGPNPPTITKEFSPMNTRPNVPTRLTLKIRNNEATPITLTQNLVDNLPSSPAQMTIAPTPNLSVTNGVPVVAAAGTNLFFIPSGTVLPPGLTQISLDVIAPVNGQYCNGIGVNALQTSSCNNVTADTACVLVNDAFVLSPIIKKAFAATRIEANQTTLLTITVENRNSFPLTLSEDFSDYLPKGLVTAGAAAGTCGAVTVVGDTTITLAKGTTLAAGICTITVPVKSAAAGTYCNRILMNAMLTQGGGKTNLGNEDQAEACVEVVNTPIFDLALTKKLAAGQKSLVLVGDTVTHNLEVINQGTVAATNVQVTDYIPASMSLVADATWTLSAGNAVLATPIASLAPGETKVIPIKVKILSGAAGDTLVNRAEISAASGGTDRDSRPDNNSTNDGGGKFNSPSDDSVNGDGTGTPGSTSGLTDEDDADPDYVVLTQCVNSNLAAGVILSPKTIRSQNDVIQITFGLTNPGAVPLSGVTFVGQVKLFNRPSATPQTLTLTKQGDTNNDGIMQPNESWLYTGTFSSTYTPGTVFIVTGEATATCGSATIKAATADLLYTVGVNMDVVIKDKCYQPGSKLEVDFVTRLLIDEDAALNPGSITVGGINIPLPKRRFEARGLMITIQGLNNSQPFDPFNPPAGITLTKFTEQGGVDAGRNTNNILDESDPVNTYRAPCTALGQDDVGCDFPDWVFHLQIPVPANYTGNTFSVTASDEFQLFQSVEDPAGSGTFKPFEDITPGTGAGGADTDEAASCTVGSIGDYVWKDTNNNGVQDAGEPGVAGVIMKLTGWFPTGIVVTYDTTDVNGFYNFPNLPAGNYQVEIQLNSLPAGYVLSTKRNEGTDDTKDSDFDPTTGLSGPAQSIVIDPSGSGLTKDNPTIDAALTTSCTKPVLTAGNVVCSGTTYSVVFYSSTSNVTTSAGTISGNTVSGIPVGTNVTLTATQSAGCSSELTVKGPASCTSNPNCVTPSLIVGQPTCNGTGTYSVSFYNDRGTVSVNAGSISGYSVVNIPVGTSLLITATEGSCVSQSTVLSPVNCNNVCENPALSISGPICDPTSPNTYRLNYILSAGATLTVSAGTVGASQITGIPVGTPVTLTVKVAGCTDRAVVFPPVYCSPAKVDLHLKKLISKKQAKVGDVIDYTIKVWNESSTPATGVVVSDSLNAGIEYVSSSATRGSYSASSKQWSIGNIGANGDTVTLTIRVKVLSEGVWFNTAEITKTNEGDVDSTPGNRNEDEDDIDHACFTVPVALCVNEKVQASVPAQYTGVQWFKNGGSTPIATGNVVLLSEVGTYTFTSLNNACPAQGCCPIIIESGSNCCPAELCIPLTIKKRRK